MITVLVDYQNVVGKFGLVGAEYLSEDDDLCIFYSNECANIRKAESMYIEESGCSFRLCKLKAPRKNALDFYIAAEAGIAFMSGSKHIIIVTRDIGLESIRDYFKVKNYHTIPIIASTIEEGLWKLSEKEDCELTRLIRSKNRKIDLTAECARIDERKRIKEIVTECLSGTEYADEVARVLSCIEKTGTTSKKDLYRGSLHEFGIASGTVIYNMLKQVV